MEVFFFLLVIIIVLIIIGNIASSASQQEHPTASSTRPTIRFEVTYGGSHYDDDRRLKGPAADPENLWVTSDRTLTVGNYQIPGGLIYVGENLASNAGYIEPALINPNLPVDISDPDRTGSLMSYWPSYTSISPKCRAAYLDWLSRGRSAQDANIGYVFIFFYGLERRLLLDAKNSEKAKSEAPTIINEVERLLTIYGANSSFSTYANNFLEYARFAFLEDSYVCRPEDLHRSWLYPLGLKLALSRYVEKQQPLPADWALAWAELDPQRWFRTPAHRCREEFAKLFQTRYSEEFGNGIVLRPNKTKIVVEYRPASSGFYGTSIRKEIEKPDVTSQSQPLRQIHEVAERCINDLDAYSRFIGRRPEEKNSLAALGLLPHDLVQALDTGAIKSLRTYLEGISVAGTLRKCLPAIDLLRHFGLHEKAKLTKTEIVSVAEMLGKLGYAIIPDARFDEGRFEPKQSVILDKALIDPAKFSPSQYGLAVMFINLAVSVTVADDVIGSEEESLLESHIEKTLNLSEAEKERLRLYLEWSLKERPDLSGLKRKFGELEMSQREVIAAAMIRIANADGVIHPQEIKALERVYKVLDIDSERIYSDVHQEQTQDSDDLTLVVIPKSRKGGHKIPSKKIQEVKHGLIDENKVQRTIENTKEVQAILAQVFTSTDEEAESAPSVTSDFMGLDKPHCALLKELLEKSAWGRNEYEALCARFDILPSGAIETINERSFETLNDALIEDGDQIVVNLNLAKEIPS